MRIKFITEEGYQKYSICLTECPNLPKPKSKARIRVGSVACLNCKYFKNETNFNNKRYIECKFPKWKQFISKSKGII